MRKGGPKCAVRGPSSLHQSAGYVQLIEVSGHFESHEKYLIPADNVQINIPSCMALQMCTHMDALTEEVFEYMPSDCLKYFVSGGEYVC